MPRLCYFCRHYFKTFAVWVLAAAQHYAHTLNFVQRYCFLRIADKALFCVCKFCKFCNLQVAKTAKKA